MDTATYFTLESNSQRARVASDVVTVDGWAFFSGVAPIDLRDDRIPIPELVEDQTKKIFSNLRKLLAEINFSTEDIVSVRIYVAEYDRFYSRVDRVYESLFKSDRRPARTSIGVSNLTRGALVEMD